MYEKVTQENRWNKIYSIPESFKIKQSQLLDAALVIYMSLISAPIISWLDKSRLWPCPLPATSSHPLQPYSTPVVRRQYPYPIFSWETCDCPFDHLLRPTASFLIVFWRDCLLAVIHGPLTQRQRRYWKTIALQRHRIASRRNPTPRFPCS